MRTARRFFADLFYLTKPYFGSEEWKSAWALLTLLVALNLAQVGLGLWISFARSIFYTALQEKHAVAFFRGLFWYTPQPHGLPMPGFVWIGVVLIACGVLSTYVQQWLQIRWRRWMTARFVENWLDGHAHFRMMLTNDTQAIGADNPDQRIAEDVDTVTDNSLAFATGLIANVVTIISYGGLLWALSGPLVLFGVDLPGYLFWSAVLYSVLITWISHLVGRPLAALTFAQQRFSGNFRFALVRVRDNAEAISLSAGESEERRGLGGRFADVYANFIRIMNRSAWLSVVTGGFGYVTDVFPTAITAPRFFAGKISFGTITQIQQIFAGVSGALLWFMNNYAAFASYAAQVERLATFQRSLNRARAIPTALARAPAHGGTVAADGLFLALPDGRPLLAPTSLTLEPGVSTAIVGPSGTGKTTLFRALAGIWPFAGGTIAGPPLGSLFLSQKPYLPEGTLRRVLCYPQHPDEVDDASLRDALTHAGLARLADEIDVEAPWSQRLSPGEQQRVAFVRTLLLRPSWLFLDEATASLDGDAERALYALVRERLPDTTIVSITHRAELASLHDRVLRLQAEAGGPAALVAA